MNASLYVLYLLLFAAVAVGIGIAVLFLFRDRFYSAWARRKGERLRREEALGIPPSPRDYEYAIAFDSVGFTVTNLRDAREDSVATQWSAVNRAVAFKRDLGITDCVCLVLMRADAVAVELNEEMAGWNRLVEALPNYLPGCKVDAEWFRVVAFPAFATNETEIFFRGRNAGRTTSHEIEC